MKKRPAILSATFVKSVNIPGRYVDGRGGFGRTLLVKPASRRGCRKSWGQSIRINGRKTTLGLGAYPVITLAMGRDPRRASHGVPTFTKAAETVLAIHAANWKSGSRSEEAWRTTLRDYATPRLGTMRVDAIATADVMAVLLPIWSTKRETARRLRQRIGAVMKWAVAQGYRSDNPAGDAISTALPYAEVGGALERVRASGAYPGLLRAFEFLVLTACRSGEVRGACWEEIDREAAVWTVPAERMKAGREHRVPLSDRALAVLVEARQFADGGGLVFPTATGGTPSQSGMPKLLRQSGIAAVPQGFRSSFRDWDAECTEAPREVRELALAHVNNDRVEAAHRRSDLFERRRTLMQQWADYIVDRG